MRSCVHALRVLLCALMRPCVEGAVACIGERGGDGCFGENGERVWSAGVDVWV